MDFWKNKIAVITNSGSEIGINLIEKLADAGVKVVGLCKNDEELKIITKKLTHVKQSAAENVSISLLNETNTEEIVTTFEKIHQHGNVHVLINIISSDLNCTAIGGRKENIKKLIDENVSNLVAFIRTTACSMIEDQKRGHIITISDCQNLGPERNLSTVTTAAVSSITEILRHEFRYLNVNIKTTHIEIKSSDTLEESSRNRTKEAEDIAGVVLEVLGTPEHLQIHELWLDIVNV